MICFSKKFLIVTFIKLFLVNTIISQNEAPIILDTTPQDTISTVRRNTFTTIFNGKPGRAALYSLIIPGAGQAYNRKWWKVPLALGIDGALAYNYFYQKKQFNKFNTIYLNYLNGIKDPNTPEVTAKNARDGYRRQCEYGMVYLVIGHLVNVFDAYVDRHLIEFDDSDDVSFSPTPIDDQITFIALKIRL